MELLIGIAVVTLVVTINVLCTNPEDYLSESEKRKLHEED